MRGAGEMKPKSWKLDHHLSRNARSNSVMENKLHISQPL